MVVEMLTFDIAEEDRAGWLVADREVWTAFLQAQPGFVRKEVWTENSGVAHAVIWWESMSAWKAIDEAVVAALDARMGSWLRPATCRVFELACDD